MTENGSDPEPASEDSRLVSLEKRLDRAEAAEAERTAVNAGPESDANYRLGNRVLAELLGGSVRPVRAYNSCGLGLMGPDALAREAGRRQDNQLLPSSAFLRSGSAGLSPSQMRSSAR